MHGVTVLEELRDLLGLDEPPYRIEAFDISNLQGTDSVGLDGRLGGGQAEEVGLPPLQDQDASEGSDDFRSIAEAVGRRYLRLQKEGSRLPDLVLIDGGKGQLSSAVAALDQIGLGELPVASIAKSEEEIFVEGRGTRSSCRATRPSCAWFSRIRDEAHRFAVTYHRKLRDKRTFTTELTQIPGVGMTTARRLLQIFGSVEGVRSASETDLAGAVGPRLAGAIRGHFRPAGKEKEGAVGTRAGERDRRDAGRGNRGTPGEGTAGDAGRGPAGTPGERTLGRR